MTATTRFLRMAALAAVVAWCATTLAFAQGSKWWQDGKFVHELRLTAEQTRRIEEIFQKALPGLKQQKTALDTAEARFERLIERGDDAAVMEQVNTVEAARSELNKTRTMMLLKMKKVLTADQWAKFTALHQAAERDRTTSRPGNSGK